MRNGMFIFDNAVHAYDNSSTNVVDRQRADYFSLGPGSVGATLQGFATVSPERLPYDPDFGHKQLGIDEALRLLFEESETDMAMAQTVPISDFWKDFIYPLQLQYELKEAAPDRIVFVGGVDPNTMSVSECVTSIERQVKELGAKSFKFYQVGALDDWWAADDKEIAYPLYEKFVELGVRCVQFHKGFAFGHQIQGDGLRCLDLQKPARDFPDLQFIIHHLGWPYEDEAIQVASRFPNMVMSMAGIVQFYPLAPKMALHCLGKALMYMGPQRVIYGSEGFIWPNIQATIEIFDEMQIPEDMQEDFGYPAITPEIRAMMFGENLARIMGIDIPATKELLGVG